LKSKYFYIKTIVFVLLVHLSGYAQNSTMKGYTIKGDVVTFIFDVNDYPNIKFNGDPINDVYVSGEFNGWATDQWKMNQVDDMRYELKKALSDFTSDFDWEFKFIVNGIHWAEPSNEILNIARARTKSGKPLMTYNLKLYTAFATDYGNITFKLDGHHDAKSVILSGTFNRWDETGFKMKKTEKGWRVTLQLRPDVYEYKFIVDGQWMEDPQNPSKVINEHNTYNSVIDVMKTVEFKLCDFENANNVVLSGTFNDWSETNYKMIKKDKCWIAHVRLSGGKYHYKYIVDGVWITDPTNSIVEYDDKGHINSVCMVK
jgi:type 1 glutamine amidotransferase